MEPTFTNDSEDRAYEIDYSAPRFHLPIPGQICYYIPVATDGSVTKNHLFLVKCIEEGLLLKKEANATFWHLPIKAQELNEITGKVVTDDDGTESPLLDLDVKCDKGAIPIGRPRFAAAKKIVRRPQPSTTDILHVVALANAKFLDIRQELTQLAVQMKQYLPSPSPKTIRKLRLRGRAK